MIFSNIYDITFVKNVIFIDKSVYQSEIFFDNLNAETFGIIYDINTTREEIYNLLKEKFTNIERIALVIDNLNNQSKMFINNEYFFTPEDLLATDNQIYSENLKFILQIIREFNVKNYDNLMCYSLLYENWLNYYDIIKRETSVIVSASNDETGNLNYGGDWLLESSGIDIELIYFTNGISNYSLTLAVQTLSGAQGTTVYLRYNSSAEGVQYSTNQVSWTQISGWPVTILNSTASPTSAFTVKLVSNIIINTTAPTTAYNPVISASSGHFIFGSNYIIFDGDYYTIFIDGITSYEGLIENGTGTNAFLNTTVTRLGVATTFIGNTPTSSLNGSSAASGNTAGWIGQTAYGVKTNNTLYTNTITKCWVYGPVANSAGGIIGSNSQYVTINSCYNSYKDKTNPTTTPVIDSKAGGIVGGNCSNLQISNCYVWGVTNTSANPGGGIAGDSYSNSTGFITNCYCLYGAIATNAGGYTGTHNYALGGSSWSSDTASSNANTSLLASTGPIYNRDGPSPYPLVQQSGTVWTDISYTTLNQPWLLTAFNRNPYVSTGANPLTKALPWSTISVTNTRFGSGSSYQYTLIGYKTKNAVVTLTNGDSPTSWSVTTANSSINVSPAPTIVTTTGTITNNISSGSYYYTVLYEDATTSSYTISQLGNNDPICYLGTTKILCIVNNKETWIPIKDLSKGILVKTYERGPQKIIKLAKSLFANSKVSNNKKLYKLSTEKNPDLFEDLYITGNHSILVDKLTKDQEEKSLQIWSKFEKLQEKYLLMAYVNENAEPCEFEDLVEVYQIVLENRSSRNRYGIYANGILSESMSLAVYHRKRDRINNYSNSDDNKQI